MNRASLMAKVLATSILLLALCVAGCSSTGTAANDSRTVLVAGATGGTGRPLVRNLLAQGYTVTALVRDEKKARTVLGDDVSYAVGDVRDIASISAALAGNSYVISAIGSTRSDKDNSPEAVDYMGIKNLADAAARANIRQFVLVSSSGVTQEDHFLNKMLDNVLIWKFKGEEALRASGVPYTIVRPGGLVNKPGGSESLVFAQGDTTAGTIAREDVALICIAALQEPAAVNKTFETYSSGESGRNEWPAMFGALAKD